MLLKKAEEIRLSDPEEIAVEQLKQAGFSEADARLNVAQHIMEKEACEALTHAGVDIEEALSLVKAAGIHLKDLVNYQEEAPVVHQSVDLLKQAAECIETLEDEVAELKAELIKVAEQKLVQEVQLPEMFTKAASNGAFTKEDLVELQKFNPDLLTKVANVMDEPWGMGNGVGMVRPKTDPMLDFILS